MSGRVRVSSWELSPPDSSDLSPLTIRRGTAIQARSSETHEPLTRVYIVPDVIDFEPVVAIARVVVDIRAHLAPIHTTP